jgi:hypothetical protein
MESFSQTLSATPPPTIIKTQAVLPESLMGLLKMASVLSTLAVIAILLVFEGHSIVRPLAFQPNKTFVPLATIPYTSVLYPDLGMVPTPRIDLAVKGKNSTEDITFLLDSGAIISAIPSKHVKKLGLSLENSKRIILSSLTTKTIFGYILDVEVGLTDETSITIPIAFADISEPVLGRHGFFDTHTIIFDATEKAVTIGQNQPQ